MSQKHKLTEVIAFGERLIKTEDLDPVYCALVRAKLPQRQLYRLLLAYFCFYHLGASAQLSEWEGNEYWDLMENAAANTIPPNMNGEWPGDRWPRGTERRHFRGQKCVDAIKVLRAVPEDYPADNLRVASSLGRIPLVDIMARVQAFPMFGPWIAFKVADVLERVLGVPIDFPNDITLFYAEPRKALDMLDSPAEEANAKLLKHFGRFLAPPTVGRRCNIQEVETILCKAKSSWSGKYWVGKDIHEIRNGLRGWGDTADKLFKVMPPEVDRGLFA